MNPTKKDAAAMMTKRCPLRLPLAVQCPTTRTRKTVQLHLPAQTRSQKVRPTRSRQVFSFVLSCPCCFLPLPFSGLRQDNPSGNGPPPSKLVEPPNDPDFTPNAGRQTKRSQQAKAAALAYGSGLQQTRSRRGSARNLPTVRLLTKFICFVLPFFLTLFSYSRENGEGIRRRK